MQKNHSAQTYLLVQEVAWLDIWRRYSILYDDSLCGHHFTKRLGLPCSTSTRACRIYCVLLLPEQTENNSDCKQ
jgi:hypothetical protein